MHKQAALNTFLIVSALTLTAVGFYAMMTIDPLYTVITGGVLALGFLVKAIYNIEVAKAKAMELM